MNALVLKENAVLTYSDIPAPSPRGPRDHLIKVAAAGVCGSDIHRGFESGAYHYPLVMGHEFSGTVEKAPADSPYHPGKPVTVFPLIPCKQCDPCRSGDYAQCVDYDYLGSRSDGAFAEYVYAPRENLFAVPAEVDLVHAAMTEPCAVALHGVRKLDIQSHHTGLVFGGGPIGLMTAQWLRIAGCRTVMVVEVDQRKLALGNELGLDMIDARGGDAVEAVFGRTGGRGADRVVEACGLPLTFVQALRAAARFGQVVFMGNISADLALGTPDFSSILRKELTIRGTWNSRVVERPHDDWSTVLEHMDRDMQVGPLISHTLPLSEGPEVLRAMAGRKVFFNKVIFVND